ncbi:EndoU domain-containing protein [Saccharopolyspora phatthalungensis]|uniref:WXG100 family type VII secretion target n=1 Tax=Saccharopolyspora phatthalungensis TaxID=664693 RepID=A0A840QD69_9PSEU|nr:EndoU domain-containing protein [Saccharopolyspora phatthalungensis]MBB5157730.1 WXG100 family type VII secretion target [Saccharopolyspora phatthalungensis]
MDRFAVRYAAVGEAWESVRNATYQIRVKLADIAASLGPLRASWTGQAAESFEAARATWVHEAEEMTEFLDGMADLLSLIDENYRSAHQANLAIWDAAAGSSGGSATVPMSAGPAAGPDGEVDVSIEELRRAARSFHGLQQQLADNMGWISRNLHASAAGMAGADPVLAPWRTLYDDTARAVWAVLGAATDLLGGIAQGMTDTGNNYVASEEASTAGHGGQLPERLTQLPVDAVRPGAEPPPSGSGAPAQALEDWGYEYWPDADPAGLMYAYNEWKELAGKLATISQSGDSLINGLVGNNHGAVFDGIRQYWATKSQLCGTSEILPVLTATCTGLSESCRLLSNGVKLAQDQIAELNQRLGDTDLFSILGILRNTPLIRAAELGIEIGQFMAIKKRIPEIKSIYEYEREEAVRVLSAGGRLGLLQAWAASAQAVTVESERRAYDQADQGLERHIGVAPYSGWDNAPVPHPDPAATHITADRATHILDGDPPPGRGGGHVSGTGKPGKTEFPPDWSRMEILGHVQDIARNPDQISEKRGGRWEVYGSRDGVRIKVVLESDGEVVTAYPVSGPGVHENPRRK